MSSSAYKVLHWFNATTFGVKTPPSGYITHGRRLGVALDLQHEYHTQFGEVWRPFGGHNWSYGTIHAQSLKFIEENIDALRKDEIFKGKSEQYPHDVNFARLVMETYIKLAKSGTDSQNYWWWYYMAMSAAPAFYLFGWKAFLLLTVGGIVTTELDSYLYRNNVNRPELNGCSIWTYFMNGAIFAAYPKWPYNTLTKIVAAGSIGYTSYALAATHRMDPPAWYRGVTKPTLFETLDGLTMGHHAHYVGLIAGFCTTKFLAPIFLKMPSLFYK